LVSYVVFSFPAVPTGSLRNAETRFFCFIPLRHNRLRRFFDFSQARKALRCAPEQLLAAEPLK
jgi:hypothetical protein